jgi:hypothetical protein
MNMSLVAQLWPSVKLRIVHSNLKIQPAHLKMYRMCESTQIICSSSQFGCSPYASHRTKHLQIPWSAQARLLHS